eukprot:12865969-Alexandrium_andersonii.AAC.1
MAASKAFWQLPESYLDHLIAWKQRGIQGPLFEKLKALIAQILGPLPASEVLEIVAQRMFPAASKWGT